MFDIHKTGMVDLPCGEETMLSRFRRIPVRDGQTDGQTDRQNCYINIARQCMKKKLKWCG